MTITSYQPLQSFAQPPPPQQRKQAFTFTLMIMTVAFATLLTIIRLTISTDLTVQTFAPPTIFDVTNANLRHSVPNNHVQVRNQLILYLHSFPTHHLSFVSG